MSRESFLGRVEELGALTGRAETLRAVRAVLVGLGERLRDDEREALARELPPDTLDALSRCAYRGDFGRDELFARVARHGGTDLGFAIERTEVVLRALAEALPGEALLRLRKQLGADIAALLDEPDPGALVPRWRSTAGGTLASGREGSRHPLSEARPSKD
jgi:uncharacterized protein (DUF2267 family)